MEEFDEEEKLIRKYLLGEPGVERERVEERMLTEPAFFERVLATEAELFDDFVHGEVSPTERERVTSHLLSAPEQFQKLETAKALKAHVEGEHTSGVWRLFAFTSEHRLGAGLALASVLLVALLAAYGLLKQDPLERELARLNGPPAASAPPGQRAHTLLSLRLRDLEAGDREKLLALPPGSEIAPFHLVLHDDDYESYRVTLLRGAEAKPLHVGGLKPITAEGVKVLPVRIPARILPPGPYELTLSGVAGDGRVVENIDRYPFRIVDGQK